jgi:hypothetical protein
MEVSIAAGGLQGMLDDFHVREIGFAIKKLPVLGNVFHHHPGQPITLVSFSWRNQLLLCIFNFIAVKQGTYVRRALI